MNHTSRHSKNAGFLGHEFALIMSAFFLFFVAVWMAFNALKTDFDSHQNCIALSESAKELASMRNDDFVIDSSVLNAIAQTKQPSSFWFRKISEEMRLIENDDYIVIGDGGNKRYLLTIDAARGFSAKMIENDGGGGLFHDPRPETYKARRIFECLQKSYFQKGWR